MYFYVFLYINITLLSLGQYYWECRVCEKKEIFFSLFISSGAVYQ